MNSMPIHPNPFAVPLPFGRTRYEIRLERFASAERAAAVRPVSTVQARHDESAKLTTPFELKQASKFFWQSD